MKYIIRAEGKTVTCYRSEDVTYELEEEFGIEPEEAIEASSWCETAYFEEVFYGTGYIIEMEEE